MVKRQPSAQAFVAATSFLALFSIVGLALYGLPLYYDFMVKDFGWSRTQVTSGNAISKLIVGPLFGFIAGWLVDSFGPRRFMLTGVVMAGGALIGLSVMSALWMFYLFYLTGRIPSPLSHPRNTRRPEWEADLLRDCAARLGYDVASSEIAK